MNTTNYIARTKDLSVGPRFLSVSNTDLVGLVKDRFANQDISLYASKRSERKLMINIKIKELTIDVPELGGLLTPTIWIKNDNTGKAALTIGVGLFRFICSNGLFIGLSDFNAKIRHVDGNKAHNMLDVLPQVFNAAVDSLENGTLIDFAVDALNTQVLDPIDVVGSLPNMTNRTKEKAIDSIVLSNNRPQDQPGNAWGLYNMLNELNKKGSRSAFAAANKDLTLLENILFLAQAQQDAAVGIEHAA